MCEPDEKSTSLPEPAGPTDEQFVYHLTPEGKQAMEEYEKRTGTSAHAVAARRSAVAVQLTAEERRMRRQERARRAREEGRRLGTVSGLERAGRKEQVPHLRLCGVWLGAAGFAIGSEYEVAVAGGQLTIRLVE